MRQMVQRLALESTLRPQGRRKKRRNGSRHLFQVGPFEYRLKFPVCKLIDRLDSDWRDDCSLPVLVARAQIEALRTAGDPEGRYRAKRNLVLGLYELGYNEQQVREIFLLVDWMMHLRVDLEKQLTREIVEFEETRKMPYITSVERFAEAVGGSWGGPRQDQHPSVAVGRGLWPADAGRRGPRVWIARRSPGETGQSPPAVPIARRPARLARPARRRGRVRPFGAAERPESLKLRTLWSPPARGAC